MKAIKDDLQYIKGFQASWDFIEALSERAFNPVQGETQYCTSTNW